MNIVDWTAMNFFLYAAGVSMVIVAIGFIVWVSSPKREKKTMVLGAEYSAPNNSSQDRIAEQLTTKFAEVQNFRGQRIIK